MKSKLKTSSVSPYSFINTYKVLTNLGANKKNDISEQKKVRMINMICILWYHALILTSFASYIVRDDSTIALIVNFCGFLFVLFCQFLNTKGHTSWAGFLVMVFSAFHYLMITCYIATGRFVEFFYIILPAASLIISKKTWQSIILLCVCIIFFHIPFYVFDFYNKEGILFISPLMVFLFITIFSIVLYFKLQNEKNEALLKKEKEVIETQKIELEDLNYFKNKFFINIAHELRTPLTLINGFAGQLNKEKPSKLTSGIIGQSAKMTQIVDDILDLSKLYTDNLKLDKQPYALNGVLTSLYQSFEHSFSSKGISFKLFENENDLEFKVDLVYFERAINNILLNALKFTEQGEVTLSTVFKNDQVNIIIKDTGIGIDESELEKVFTEFYQVDNDINNAGGSGVGLSFSKSIIELHEGTIKIESRFGEGTTFKIALPAHKTSEQFIPDLETIHEDVPVIQKINHKESTILVVEDHSEMRGYIASLLSDFRVLEAENGIEALKVIEQNPVDFVVTDYMMPKMDGYELLQKLNLTHSHIPVMVLTARADTEAKLKMLRLGIDDYLIKPFNAEELLIRIENSLTNNHQKSSYLSEEGENIPPEAKEFVTRLSDFVSKNCSNNIFSLEVIREEFALSTSSLYRKVKSETGLSPIEFVKEVRLQKVRKALEADGNTPLKSLTLLAGFSNTTYLKKQYSNRFGTVLT